MLYPGVPTLQGSLDISEDHKEMTMTSDSRRGSLYSNTSNPKLLIRRGSLDDKMTISRTATNRLSSRRHSSPVILEEYASIGNKMLFKAVSTTLSPSSTGTRNNGTGAADDKLPKRHLPQINEATPPDDEKENCGEEFESIPSSRRGSDGVMPALPTTTPRRHRLLKPSKFIDIETFQRITKWMTDVDDALGKETETEKQQTIELPAISKNGCQESPEGGASLGSDS